MRLRNAGGKNKGFRKVVHVGYNSNVMEVDGSRSQRKEVFGRLLDVQDPSFFLQLNA